MVDPQDVQFYWLAADGTQQSGTEPTLRAALSAGALVAATLVWRKGWSAWLPANRVPELASSMPEAKPEKAQQPSHDLDVDNPSLTPTAGKSAAVAPRAALAASTRPTSPSLRAPSLSSPAASRSMPAGQERARDTLAPSSFGHLGPSPRPTAKPAAAVHPSGTPPPPPPPRRSRSPMPTLGEERGVVSATATLRPPGAVPPPARGVPAPAFDSSPRSAAPIMPAPSFAVFDGKQAVLRSPALPAFDNQPLLSEAAPLATAPTLDSTLEVAEQLPAGALRTPVVAPPRAPAAVESSPAQEAQRPAAKRDSQLQIGHISLESRAVLMALSALSVALLVAVIGLWLSRSPKEAAAPLQASAGSVTAAAPVPSAHAGCTLLLPAARVAASIERTVPPYTAKLANEAGLALGFADSKTKGVGLRLDPTTLDVLPSFEEEAKDAVRGVVPLTRSGALAFFVDRDDRALRSAHTVDQIPPFTLGLSDAGFSRVVAGSASLVWPLAGDTKITEPRSAPLGTFGYGITFRRGGQSGSVMLGFVGSDGAKKSELLQIPDAPKFLGTPMIAGRSNAALVAFAGRDTPEGAWKLYVSQSLPGGTPSPARALSAGDGGSVISPTLAALSGDRWLVQWTEGVSEQYHVHVQSFAADLSPIGRSVLVSPKGANAGQGSLATFGDGALTLFILTTAGHDELWGATLTCQ